MRTLRLSSCFLILPLWVAGCAATSAVSPKMRTVASVGDRTLPVVTGEPGNSVAAEHPAPPRPPRRDGRISGRVYDEKGEPIADARVRLAVGGAPGGKVASATTDRTGAFTLRGVRPGTSYTVIAELEDEQGPLTGRSVVQAPDTDVRITLGVSERGTAGAKRVSPISEREESTEEDELDEDGAGRPRVNVEDLPPTTEAEALAPDREARATSSSSREAGTRVAGWRRVGSDGRMAAGRRRSPAPRSGTSSPAPEDPEAHEAAAPFETPAGAEDEGAEEDDEGPNPLPPALEPGQVSRASTAPPDLIAAAQETPAAAPEELPASMLGGLPPVAESSAPESPLASAPADRMPPPAREAATAAAVSTEDPFDGPAALESSPGPAPGALVAAPPTSDQSVFEAEAKATDPLPSAPATPPDTRKRPTWNDLAAREPAPPLVAARDVVPAGYPPARPMPGQSPRAVAAPARAAPPPPPPRDAGQSFCDYDRTLRRIKDFRLPDLEGRPVRFHELDADLVLLDFWGTWCQPCIRSVPHLIDLQKRLGPAKLKVVGVACEQGPVAERTRKVDQEVRRLGINYPILMSGMDGPCPLQKELQIQAFPTLILVDRQGRIVWRDQGATPVTLARLDRFLAMAAKPEHTRRY